MSKGNSTIVFAVGILAGVVGGVIAGLLIAPKSGEETRKNLKVALDDLGEKLSPEIQEAKRQAVGMINSTKCKVETMYREFNENLKAEKMARAKNKEGHEVYGV